MWNSPKRGGNGVGTTKNSLLGADPGPPEQQEGFGAFPWNSWGINGIFSFPFSAQSSMRDLHKSEVLGSKRGLVSVRSREFPPGCDKIHGKLIPSQPRAPPRGEFMAFPPLIPHFFGFSILGLKCQGWIRNSKPMAGLDWEFQPRGEVGLGIPMARLDWEFQPAPAPEFSRPNGKNSWTGRGGGFGRALPAHSEVFQPGFHPWISILKNSRISIPKFLLAPAGWDLGSP